MGEGHAGQPRTWAYVAAVFCLSFYVMAVEILGIRLIAPYHGMTHVSWAASITMVLTGMSAGAWLGGFRLRPTDPARTVAMLMVIVALATALIALGKDRVLPWLAGALPDHAAAVFVAFAVLLLPVAFLAAAAAPLCYKGVDDRLRDARRTAGLLHGVSALGSIAGVVSVSIVLLPLCGHTAILKGLVAVLCACALALRRARAVVAGAVVAVALACVPAAGMPGSVLDQDSAYYRIRVTEARGHRELTTDNFVSQSVIRLSDRQGTLVYQRAILEALPHLVESPRRALILGGGAFVLSRTLRERFPDLSIDTVEIDPTLRDLGERWFFYRPGPRDRAVFEDARTFLRRGRDPYDVVLVDVFGGGGGPPFHLVTREFAAELAAHVAPDGVAIVNLYTATAGAKGEFFRRTYRGLREAFAAHRVLCIGAECPTDDPNNVLLVLSHDPVLADRDAPSTLGVWRGSLGPGAEPAFTDDHAPVEHLSYRALR